MLLIFNKINKHYNYKYAEKEVFMNGDFTVRPSVGPEKAQVPKEKKSKKMSQKDETIEKKAQEAIDQSKTEKSDESKGKKLLGSSKKLKLSVEGEKEKPLAETPVEGGTQLSDMPSEMLVKILNSIEGNPKEKLQALKKFSETSKEHNAISQQLAFFLQFELSQHVIEMNRFIQNGSLPSNMEKFMALAFSLKIDQQTKQRFFERLVEKTGFTFNMYAEKYGKEDVNRVYEALENWGKDIKIDDKLIESLRAGYDRALVNREDKASPHMQALSSLIAKLTQLKNEQK